MRVVIRRFAPFLVLFLTLTACAGSERVAVDAGDSSLTRGELIEVTNSINAVPPESLPIPIVNATQLRFNGTLYVRSLVFLDYFDSQGLVDESLRTRATDQISELFNAGQLGPLAFEEAEYNAVVMILMASELLAVSGEGTLDFSQDANFPDQGSIFEEFGGDYEIESRIGQWDEESFSIIPS